mgnify:CR=1 FL=1
MRGGGGRPRGPSGINANAEIMLLIYRSNYRRRRRSEKCAADENFGNRLYLRGSNASATLEKFKDISGKGQVRVAGKHQKFRNEICQNSGLFSRISGLSRLHQHRASSRFACTAVSVQGRGGGGWERQMGEHAIFSLLTIYSCYRSPVTKIALLIYSKPGIRIHANLTPTFSVSF